MDENNKMKHTYMLGLKDIASWVIPIQAEHSPKVRAFLPSLQRGFVWKAEQIETLWDSIAQGFPIGSLLLCPYDKKKGKQFFNNQQGVMDPTKDDFHLLDGQQRASSIALGFLNVWETSKKTTSALWVDLMPIDKSDRKYSFRLVTKSHPWGYSRNKPAERLKDWQARDAVDSFRLINKKPSDRPHEFEIFEVFPWDTKSPVPLALLLAAIKRKKSTENIARFLMESLESTQLWSNPEEWPPQFNNVKSILSPPYNSVDFSKFEELAENLRNALLSPDIPAIVSNINSDKNNDKDEHDATFNLFKRVNTGGTTLSPEEIKYSLLKSIWIEAPDIIEDRLLKGREFAQPARMVSLMSRLFLMTNESHDKKSRVDGLQPDLQISQFKKIINEHGKKDEDSEMPFRKFCIDEGSEVVKDVWGLLTDNSYGLPKFLAAQISRSSSDLILLLMYWIYLMRKNKMLISELSDNERKRILGFVTSIGWFANEQGRCVKKLAQKLGDSGSDGAIRCFFNQESLKCILDLDDQDRILMMPLPTPKMLESAILYDDLKMELNKNYPDINSNLWKRKNLEQHYLGDQPIERSAAILPSDWNHGKEQKRKDAAWLLIKNICRDSNRHLLAYAQRGILKDDKWFGWFDPTQPDQIRDRNRPWDYDHILPQSWSNHQSGRIFQELPNLVRIWIWVIGNFRIWPLELNRSKGAKTMIEESIEAYDLNDKKSVLEKSFIREIIQERWMDLEKILPRENDKEVAFWKGREDSDDKKHWQVFIEASIYRTIDIYREWYDQCQISSLMSDD